MDQFDAACKKIGIRKENPLEVQGIELKEAAYHKPDLVYSPQSFRKHFDSDNDEPEMDSEDEHEEDPQEEPEDDPEEELDCVFEPDPKSDADKVYQKFVRW